MAVRVGRRTPGPLSGGVDSDPTRGGGATDPRGVRPARCRTDSRRLHFGRLLAGRGPGERAIDLRAGACETCVVALVHRGMAVFLTKDFVRRERQGGELEWCEHVTARRGTDARVLPRDRVLVR